MNSQHMTFGTCTRCNCNDAHYMPLRLCETCHKEFSAISKYFEPGTEERRQAVTFVLDHNMTAENAAKLVRGEL